MDTPNVPDALEVRVQKNEDGRMFMLKFAEEIIKSDLVKYVKRRGAPIFTALVNDGHCDTLGRVIIPVKFACRLPRPQSDGIYRAFVSYKTNGTYEPKGTEH